MFVEDTKDTKRYASLHIKPLEKTCWLKYCIHAS